jgi:hypothetical protein
MQVRSLAGALAGLLASLVLAPSVTLAARSDGIEPSILAPGLVQANEAIDRLEHLLDEADAIGTALFRIHNEFGANRSAMAAAAAAAKNPPPSKEKDKDKAKEPPARLKAEPDCTTPWLIDLGARSRQFGRSYRDAVQSVRVQGRRVENVTVEPTVQPLLDPETTHRVLTLLTRVDDLVRGYPEAASWQEKYVEPLVKGCELALVPAPGIPDAAPRALKDPGIATGSARQAKLVAVLAFGGGYLCPGAVPAAGVMLVSGAICYSASETCACEPMSVSPATVLGPEANAGSAN